MSQYDATTPPTDRHAALRDYIGTARWFGGKGRSFSVVKISDLDWLQAPGQWPAVRTEIVELSYPPTEQSPGSSTSEYYQLLMAYRPDEAVDEPSPVVGTVCRITDPDLGPLAGFDGVFDAEARRILLIRLLGEHAATSDAGSISFRLRDRAGLEADLPSNVFGGQQSNTSIMFGDIAMLKLFRRLELGRNLDIEAHQVLSEAGVTDVARLFGWAEGTWTSADGARHSADLSMLVEKLAEATDGWELALERLGEGADFTTEATALGSALREIHTALRANFATDLLPGDELADTMNARLEAAAAVAPQLTDYTEGLRRRFDALRGRDLEVQRVHGDFHLGQTLHTPTGWKIIDFEGEPAKTMAERLAPDSVWRDLAGMLRSFDYAAASRPGPDSADWFEACRDGFLAGYLGGLDDNDRAVLAAYEADKAVYEVVYETRNRPDWIAIPLSAVALISGLSTDAALGGTR